MALLVLSNALMVNVSLPFAASTGFQIYTRGIGFIVAERRSGNCDGGPHSVDILDGVRRT